jgi:hypothetical protein
MSPAHGPTRYAGKRPEALVAATTSGSGLDRFRIIDVILTKRALLYRCVN